MSVVSSTSDEVDPAHLLKNVRGLIRHAMQKLEYISSRCTLCDSTLEDYQSYLSNTTVSQGKKVDTALSFQLVIEDELSPLSTVIQCMETVENRFNQCLSSDVMD